MAQKTTKPIPTVPDLFVGDQVKTPNSKRGRIVGFYFNSTKSDQVFIIVEDDDGKQRQYYYGQVT